MKQEKKEDLLNKYYSFYNDENWERANIILKSLIKTEPNSFWLWTSLSSVTYELRDYKKALKYSKKAYELNSESPLVLWDYAGVLYMLEKHQKAIRIWKIILGYGEQKVGKKLTSEGVKWASKLINDCRFKLGQSYYFLDKDIKSKKYFEEYLTNRKKGVSSIFRKKEALEYLKELDEIIANKN